MDSDYVDRAIDLIERNFLLIAAELWRKLKPRDEKRAEILLALTVDALKSTRYGVAEATSRFTMEDKKQEEGFLLMGQLNFWQTQKWAGNFDSVRADIEGTDFSAKDDLFQLGRLILLDRYDDALPLIEDLLQRKKLDLESLEEWPIFKVAREDIRVSKLVESRRSLQRERVHHADDALELTDGTPETPTIH